MPSSARRARRCSGIARREDALAESRLYKVASINELFPFEQTQAAYDRMMGGKARFRFVLEMGQ